MICSLADIGHHHNVKHSHSDKRDGSKQKEKDVKRKGEHFIFRTLSVCYAACRLYIVTKQKRQPFLDNQAFLTKSRTERNVRFVLINNREH